MIQVYKPLFDECDFSSSFHFFAPPFGYILAFSWSDVSVSWGPHSASADGCASALVLRLNKGLLEPAYGSPVAEHVIVTGLMAYVIHF